MSEDKLVAIHKNIGNLLRDKMQALPKGFNETRFLQNCMTVLQDTKNIEKMEPRSIARTMLKGAFLGLDFLNKECYAIPYGNQLNFQTDYKGEIKLAKKYSLKKIADIYAKVVREGDTFEEFIRDGRQYVNFTPETFNNKPIIGAFAVCLYEDGSMLYDTMSLKEMEHIRQTFSKMPNSLMWKETPGEGYKKTVLRRLTKLIELEFDSAEQKKEYDDAAEFEFKNITDIEAKEPIKMPKEKKIPAKASKTPPEPPESTQIEKTTDDMPEPDETEEEQPEVPKKGRSQNDIVSNMQSWAKKKNIDLALMAMENFEKEFDDLDLFELGQLENIVALQK